LSVVYIQTEKGLEMARIDLSGYNLGELKGLQHGIEKEIKGREQQDSLKKRVSKF
jgi:hypothetical protein